MNEHFKQVDQQKMSFSSQFRVWRATNPFLREKKPIKNIKLMNVLEKRGVHLLGKVAWLTTWLSCLCYTLEYILQQNLHSKRLHATNKSLKIFADLQQVKCGLAYFACCV